MTARIKTTERARFRARQAHRSLARSLSRDNPFAIDDLARYLDLGADAGLTIAETLTVVERAAAENRRPDEELSAMLRADLPADIDLTPEEQEAMLQDVVDAVARAMVRWVARKAMEDAAP